ncbi:hypothetical protein MKW98_009134, partial [Papaver atlanticum]
YTVESVAVTSIKFRVFSSDPISSFRFTALLEYHIRRMLSLYGLQGSYST